MRGRGVREKNEISAEKRNRQAALFSKTESRAKLENVDYWRELEVKRHSLRNRERAGGGLRPGRCSEMRAESLTKERSRIQHINRKGAGGGGMWSNQ